MPETTNLAGALALLKARAAEQITTLPLYWREDGQAILPDGSLRGSVNLRLHDTHGRQGLSRGGPIA